MARLCAANAIVVPVVLEIVLRVPVSLELTEPQFFHMTSGSCI